MVPRSFAVTLAAGDADYNLQFDEDDIVQVLQAGKYLSGNPATWSEGDFNGDGAVDLLDLDILGQNYGESLGGGVPEPATLGLLAVGGLAVNRAIRRKQ